MLGENPPLFMDLLMSINCSTEMSSTADRLLLLSRMWKYFSSRCSFVLLWLEPLCHLHPSFPSLVGMRMKTVLSWKLGSVTTWPGWCLLTLKGNSVLTFEGVSVLLPFLKLFIWVMPPWLQHLLLFHWNSPSVWRSSFFLYAGRRQSATRNSSLTCRPRSILPPWSIQSPVDTFAVVSSKAVSGSD